MVVVQTAEPLSALPPELQALLAERPGATFLRADLQVHTPRDPAFAERPEPSDAEERMALARRYLAAAKERGIQLVAITEHNDVSWIDELRRAAQDLDLYLLPGFEVESKEGIHVLCLFDPARKVAELEEVLARLGLTAAKRSSNRCELRCDRDFAELLRFVQSECGGICIAAHVEGNKGLLAAIREGARVDAWRTPELLAAQIAKPLEAITSGNGRILRGEDPNYARERLPGYVLTSDARSLEAIGSVSCWIKMDAVSVEGLRQAFLDPGSRISFTDPGESRRGARLLAASWAGDFLADVRFALNPELNCLIGGKGTGKSTVIETIRYAFGLDYRNADVKQSGEELLGHSFRSGSKVSVVIETAAPSPARYLVERTAPHAPVVRDVHGDPQPELAPAALGAPCVYGQKEIFGIAQDARARLDMVDGFAGDDLRGVLQHEARILESLAHNGQVILDAQRRIDDARERLAELPNLEEWRERFRRAGFEERLRERRHLDREARLLDRAEQWLAARTEAVEALQAERQPPPSDLEGDELPDADLLAEASQALQAVDEQWRTGIGRVHDALTASQARITDLRRRWEDRRQRRSADFDQALRELQERMPDVDPERYLDVERRIEQLTPLRQALTTLQERATTALSERERLLIELQDARGAKHRARRQAAERLNQRLEGNVRVDLTYQGDRERFVQRLASLKTGARTEALRRLVEAPAFTSAQFGGRARERTLAGFLDLAPGPANALERAVDERTIQELEVAELPDSVQLFLDVALDPNKPDYRPLERLSPGQKSTAILLLAMQESVDPLVIDQPEDDLDNRFIYDDVVKRLRAAKRSRQFLIATHNANIPILGDAEQIVALDAQEHAGGPVRSYVRACGSIDAEPVRDAAELILEGGHEAFELRRSKYSP
jgi:ABC-type cobalamin/Fe3+-siderophores transport system ATPase subunit